MQPPYLFDSDNIIPYFSILDGSLVCATDEAKEDACDILEFQYPRRIVGLCNLCWNASSGLGIYISVSSTDRWSVQPASIFCSMLFKFNFSILDGSLVCATLFLVIYSLTSSEFQYPRRIVGLCNAMRRARWSGMAAISVSSTDRWSVQH